MLVTPAGCVHKATEAAGGMQRADQMLGLRQRQKRDGRLAGWELTSSPRFSACAAATRGVVTANKKENNTVQKKNTRLLRPAAPSWSVPRLPTIAAHAGLCW